MVALGLPAYLFVKPCVCFSPSLRSHLASSLHVGASHFAGQKGSTIPSEQGLKFYCCKKGSRGKGCRVDGQNKAGSRKAPSFLPRETSAACPAGTAARNLHPGPSARFSGVR